MQINKDVTQLEIFFIEKYNLENAINHVNVIVGDSGKIYSWKSLHKELFSALEIEKKVMFLILFLIIFVAAFNLISV